jgi:sulfur carrier protein
MGIEPTSKAWEALVLPLNYTRFGAGTPCAEGAAWTYNGELIVASSGPRYSSPARNPMKVIVNGEERQFDRVVTVAELLYDMGLGQRRVAVEVNREIVPRSRHGEMQLKDQDRVEIVFAIGGG